MEVGGCNCLVFRYIDITFTIKSSFCEVDGSIEIVCLFLCMQTKERYKMQEQAQSPPLFPLRRSRLSVQGYTTSNSLMNGLLFDTALTYFFRLRICICGYCFNFGISKVGKGRKGIILILNLKKPNSTPICLYSETIQL